MLASSPMASWRVSGGHIAERAALFIIITLGESLLVTGAAFAATPITGVSFSAFLAAFVGTIVLWLLYFNHGEESGNEYIRGADETGAVARFSYTYLHVIVVLGVVLVAVADALVLEHPDGHGEPLVVGLVYGAPAIYLLGNLFFKRSIGTPWLRSHLIGIAALTVIAAFSLTVENGLSPLWHSWIVNLVLAVVLGLEEFDFRRDHPNAIGKHAAAV